jgi:Zn-dependent protease
MNNLSLVQQITVWALPLIFAITLHEVAHGYVASLFGDYTARLSGRLSLNPLKHIDLVGTILVPLALLVMGGFIFGWAKPVPVDPRNMRHPRRDMAFVGLAGPLANLLMALGWGGIAKIGLIASQSQYVWLGIPLVYMGSAGIMINVVLAVLNLIPLPPLDGGRVLSAILPPRVAYSYNLLEPYGFIILILLMMVGVLSSIMSTPVWVLVNLIGNIWGVG